MMDYEKAYKTLREMSEQTVTEIKRLSAENAELRAQLSAQSVSAVQPVAWTVDELAQEIRRVDGNHSLGAGALAEALMPFLAHPADADAVDAKVPAGWEFSSSDFSLRAHKRNGITDGCVQLIRDTAGRAAWHAMDDEERESTKLYATGFGPTFEAALNSAIIDAAQSTEGAKG